MESKRKKPRVLTLTLPSSNQPTLVLHGKNYILRNFSDEGLGVWIHPPLPKDLSKDSLIQAQVNLEDKSYSVELRLTHVSGRQHGLKILSESLELKMKLQKLLEPSLYAESLKLKVLANAEDPELHLPRVHFVGNGNSELTVWYHPGHRYIMAVQACFSGKWIYRTQGEGKKVGLLSEQFRGSDGLRILNTDLLALDSKELKNIPENASQFLTSLSYPLPGHLLWQFFETGETIFLPTEFFQILKVA